MRYAICVATPFQLFNAINLVANNLNAEDEKDLFFRNFSSEMDGYLKRIKKYNLFNNVYEYDLRMKRNYIDDLIQARFPSLYLSRLFHYSFVVMDKQYDYITVTSGTEVECALSRVFRNAKTIAFDDGLGSYIGDMIHDKKMNIFWRLFGRSNNHIRPEALYINNIDFCESTISNKHVELKKVEDCNNQYKMMILNVFDIYVSRLFTDHKVCYLTQPAEYMFSNTLSRDKIEKVLSRYASDCFVRFHPRDLDRDRLNGIFHIDDSKGIWELICQYSITEKHILVGAGSTAQLAPKLFYNIEPWIIFTHRLYSFDKRFKGNFLVFEQLANNIRNKYNSKNKVLIPNNLSELEMSIVSAIEHEG